MKIFFDTYVNLRVELDQKSFPFEAQFANFGPIESVYFGVSLEKKKKVLQ